ncbi:MAG TPA: molybdenum cofactor biosynthesis protein MoaE [Terracidiphilus sp.]|jgi:MoaE-MoaD fusion protein
MKVTILPFGVLKESLGAATFPLELPEGATVADLLARFGAEKVRGIAVSVNAEYARPGDLLREGDEVGLLPPVSGGIDAELPPGAWGGFAGRAPIISIQLQRDPIDSEALIRQAKDAEDGAIVVFDGIVRNNSRGRRTLYLDYEAYEEMAVAKLDALAAEARERFGVRFVSITHRLGRLEIGETSVLIVVAAAHRAQAYEASRFLIDMLKKTVPIWKKETFEDGAVWADGEPFPQGIEIAEAEQGA